MDLIISGRMKLIHSMIYVIMRSFVEQPMPQRHVSATTCSLSHIDYCNAVLAGLSSQRQDRHKE